MHSEEKIISDDAANVSAQGVPDAGSSGDRQAKIPQGRQSAGEAPRYRSYVRHRGRITRPSA